MKKKIEKKSGLDVALLYDFVATYLCKYFLLNKGNHRKNVININKKFSKKKNNNNDFIVEIR